MLTEHLKLEKIVSFDREFDISSVILAEGAESVLRTLLHEAVHSIAAARGIQDASRLLPLHRF